MSSVSESGVFYDTSPCRPLYTGIENDHTDNGWIWGELIDYIESMPITDGWIILHNNQGTISLEVLHEFSRWFEFSWFNHPTRLNDVGTSCFIAGTNTAIWNIFIKIFERLNMEINNVREIGIEWNYDDELRIDILDASNNKSILYFDLNRCALLTPVCSSDTQGFSVLEDPYNLPFIT